MCVVKTYLNGPKKTKTPPLLISIYFSGELIQNQPKPRMASDIFYKLLQKVCSAAYTLPNLSSVTLSNAQLTEPHLSSLRPTFY